MIFDDMLGFELVVFLVKSVKVMLIMNLWLDVGFCNGVIGMIIDFIYYVNYQLLDLFVVVIVQFDDYRGLLISNILLLCVLICLVIIFVYLFGSGIYKR